MKRIVCAGAGLFLLVLTLLPGGAFARRGKVFFPDGKWIAGDLQEQTEEDGRSIIVIAMKSGSIIIPREDAAQVLYTGPDSSPHWKFHEALKNTPRQSAAVEPPKPPPEFVPFIDEASQKHSLDPNLVKAVIRQESNFNSYDISWKGAQGLMQLMPDTARGLGVGNVFDPSQNIHGGARYLKMMLRDFNGDLSKALAAYNAGPNAVRKYGSIPPYKETQAYVRRVLKFYRMYRGTSLMTFKDPEGRLVITDRPLVQSEVRR